MVQWEWCSHRHTQDCAERTDLDSGDLNLPTSLSDSAGITSYSYINRLCKPCMNIHLPAKQTQLHVFSIPLSLPCSTNILFTCLVLVKAIKLNGAILAAFLATTAPIRKLIGITCQLQSMGLGHLEPATMVTKVDQSVSCGAFPKHYTNHVAKG